jgi:hypothetical protein
LFDFETTITAVISGIVKSNFILIMAPEFFLLKEIRADTKTAWLTCEEPTAYCHVIIIIDFRFLI